MALKVVRTRALTGLCMILSISFCLPLILIYDVRGLNDSAIEW